MDKSLKSLQILPPWQWPKDAGKTLRKILINRFGDASDRLIAVKLAGEFTVIDDKLCAVLLKILREPAESEEMRAAAAIAFGAALEQADIEIMDDGEFDDPESVPISVETFREIQQTLHTLYDDTNLPKLVRRRILEAAVRAELPWQQEAIKAAWASGDRDWMLTAVFGMHYVGGFEAEVLAALKSPDDEIHYEAIEAAGAKELKEAWPHIVALLKDRGTPKHILLAAIEAVSNISPAKAPDLLQPLTRSKNREIAETAKDALLMAEGFVHWDAEEDASDDDEDDRNVPF